MKKQTYKRTGNCGLFDLEEDTAKLESLGNPLEKLLKGRVSGISSDWQAATRFRMPERSGCSRTS